MNTESLTTTRLLRPAEIPKLLRFDPEVVAIHVRVVDHRIDCSRRREDGDTGEAVVSDDGVPHIEISATDSGVDDASSGGLVDHHVLDED
jgi:hypothetical protein